MKTYENGIIIHKNGILTDSGSTELGNVNVPQSYLESTNSPVQNDWDRVHLLYQGNKNRVDVDFMEPDKQNVFEGPFPNLFYDEAIAQGLESSRSPEDYCKAVINYDSVWTRPANEVKQIWHLADQFSQLKAARQSVTATLKNRAEKTIIRIAHLDTGYDPEHITFPENIIRTDLQKNFTGHGNQDSAVDTGDGLNGGHGCGTLSILAGNKFNNDYDFSDSIGLSAEQGIEIVPIRIAKSVVLFRSKAFEDALAYIISLYDDPEKRCHIVTMSMGGAPTRDWAKLVNKAYDKGIFMVTAAGNNFGGVSPRTLVYPARFNRVVAACGVTYDLSPYYKVGSFPNLKIMQGNYGPRRFMRTAIAAFTPNVPWAKFGCKDKVSLSGAGTSSATPQIASAAALYYQRYYQEIERLAEGWQKVEIIRKALFSSANKGNPGVDYELYFGNGILKANEMLKVLPNATGLKKENKDSAFLPVLRLFGEIVTSESVFEPSDIEEEMYNLEIQQLILNSEELQQFLGNEEREIKELSLTDRRKLAELIISLPEASQALKNQLKNFLVL